MKNIVLFLTLLFTFLGCAERYDGDNGDPPRIVNTDPPRQRIAPEVLMNYGVPPEVIKVKLEEYQTVTVTFSSPPRNVHATVGPSHALDYVLQGTQLTMTVYCHLRDEYESNVRGISIDWDGGGTFLRLWCQPEEDK